MIDLQEGRRLMKEKCIAIALKYTPENVKVIYPRQSLTGKAYYDGFRMATPRPFTRKALYIFLHECAHFILGHVGQGRSKKHRYEEEFEAEQWAHKIMRQEGLSVPRTMTLNARQYIFRKMHSAKTRGAKMRITKDKVRFGS